MDVKHPYHNIQNIYKFLKQCNWISQGTNSQSSMNWKLSKHLFSFAVFWMPIKEHILVENIFCYYMAGMMACNMVTQLIFCHAPNQGPEWWKAPASPTLSATRQHLTPEAWRAVLAAWSMLTIASTGPADCPPLSWQSLRFFVLITFPCPGKEPSYLSLAVLQSKIYKIHLQRMTLPFSGRPGLQQRLQQKPKLPGRQKKGKVVIWRWIL